METKKSNVAKRSRNKFFQTAAVMAFAMLMQLTANTAYAGAGWADQVDISGAPYKEKTWYANTPSGLQPNRDPATSATTPTVDTGTALRKFVDTLSGVPGLAPSTTISTCAATGVTTANCLGQSLPLAAPVKWVNPQGVKTNDDYYEIATVAYTEQMHSDLFKATQLRGYVQLEPSNPTNPFTPGAIIQAMPAGSEHIALTYPDGSPILDPSGAQVYAMHKPHYLGPVIVASRGVAIRYKMFNYLPYHKGPIDTVATSATYGQPTLPMLGADSFIPVDATISGSGLTYAGTDGIPHPMLQNRISIHWHGGDTPWISDGTPHQWFAPAGEAAYYKVGLGKGASFQNVPDMPDPGPGAQTLYYPNNLSSRLMFYHDHASGMTRLNVYMGEAAGYLVTDPVEQNLTNTGVLPSEQIPLVIQDRTFVPKNIAQQDDRWNVDTTGAAVNVWGTEGDFWFPHVYETNQDPNSFDGTNPAGRWDWGPWFWPIFPAIYSLPSGYVGDVTTTPEAFMDTPVVNGTVYPTMTVDPKAYRFRILNASNDRTLNLSLFQAVDANGMVCNANAPAGSLTDTAVPIPGPSGVACTEVKMVGAVPTASWPPLWPTDGRDGGVPDPVTSGPDIVQIGNEGGMLPHAALIPSQPLNYEYNRRSITVLNIMNHGLLLGGAERADAIIDFSQFAGKTLILYNDAPAPVPAFDPRIDYWTGGTDYSSQGGAFTPLAGYGPNIRTVMQIVVRNTAPAAAFLPPAPGNMAADTAANANLNPLVPIADAAKFTAFDNAIAAAYALSQDHPIVPQEEYNTAFGTHDTPNYGRIYTGAAVQPTFDFTPSVGTGMTINSLLLLGGGSGYLTAPTVSIVGGNIDLTPAGVLLGNHVALAHATIDPITHFVNGLVLDNAGQGYTAAPQVIFTPTRGGVGATAAVYTSATQSILIYNKAIQELFDPIYGRMNATLGVEIPFTTSANATTIPLNYVDPATESISAGETQIWKITHNGVDSHPVHFHMVNLQVINRIGWDGTVKSISPNEYGWKETVIMHPLEDVLVAVKAKSTVNPFGLMQSSRLLDPTQPVGVTTGLTQLNMLNAPTVVTNIVNNYDNEYVWHCHILGHEENDFMRPFVFHPTTLSSPATINVAGGLINPGVNNPIPAPLAASALAIDSIGTLTANPATVAAAAATSMVVGGVYTIASPGTTVFTTYGAANNSAGTQFTATVVGTGATGGGTVYPAVSATTMVAGNPYTIASLTIPASTATATTAVTVLVAGNTYKVAAAGTTTAAGWVAAGAPVTVATTTTAVSSLVVGSTYNIATTGTTTAAGWAVAMGTGTVATTTTVATALVSGNAYQIVALGNTTAAQWVAAGVVGTAAVGTQFVAKAAGVGTGTAYLITPPALPAVGTQFVAKYILAAGGTVFLVSPPVAGTQFTALAATTGTGLVNLVTAAGTADFTIYGAAANTVGTSFIATGTPASAYGYVYPASARAVLTWNDPTPPTASGTYGNMGNEIYFRVQKANGVTVAATATAATALIIGSKYQIATAGTTVFTTCGSANSLVGTQFAATAATCGGTGTVKLVTIPFADITTATVPNVTNYGPSTYYAPVVSATAAAATTMVVGQQYQIAALGTGTYTFATYGAISNTVGTQFTATAVPATTQPVGTTVGTVYPITYTLRTLGNATTFTDPNWTGGNVYQVIGTNCAVTTVNAAGYTICAGDSLPSNIASITNTASLAAPVQSAVPVVNATGTSVTLSWTDMSSAETYWLVEASTNGLAGPFTTVATLASTTTAAIGGAITTAATIVPGNSYTFRVTAIVATGTAPALTVTASSLPLFMTANLGAPATPAAPTAISTNVVSATSVTVGWTNNATTGNGYLVESSVNGAAYTTLATLASTAVSYTDAAVVAGTTVTYRVSAFTTNAYGTQAFSAALISQATFIGVPNAPANLVAVGGIASATSVNLTWADTSANENYYLLEISTDAGVTYPTSIQVASPLNYSGTMTYTVLNAVAGTTYTYRLSAVNGVGSSATTTATVALVAPAVPTALTAAADIAGTLATVSWTDSSTNETSFVLEVCSDGLFNAATTTTLSTITRTLSESYATGNRLGVLAPIVTVTAHSYYYRVKAINSYGTTISATTLLGAPLPPVMPSTIAEAVIGVDTINVTWIDNAPDETGYRIELSNDSGKTYTLLSEWTRSAAESASVGGIVGYVATVPLNSNNMFRVYGLKSNVYGKTYSITPLVSANIVASAPNALAAVTAAGANGGATVNLSWVDNTTNENSYVVDASTDGGVTYANMTTLVRSDADVNGTGGAVVYTANTLPGMSYTFRVAAVNGAGQSAYTTNVANLSVAQAPATPSALAEAILSPTQVYMVWTDNANNEAGYHVEVSTDGGTYFSTVTDLVSTPAQTASVGAQMIYTATVSTGANYIFRVSAYSTNSVGSRTYSPTIQSVVVPIAAPIVPTALTATPDVTGTINTLSLVDNTTNENAYTIEVSTDEGKTFTLLTTLARAAADIGGTGAVVTYAHTPVVAGGNYVYRLSASNGVGTSPYVMAVVGAPIPPAVPSNIAAAVTGATTTYLVWTDNAFDETGYRVEVSTDSGVTYSALAEWTRTNAESVSVGGLVDYTATGVAGNNNIYRVSAVKTNSVGSKSYSGTISTVSIPLAVPAAPAALTATPDVTGTLATLTWSDNTTNENAYVIEVSTDGVNYNMVTMINRLATEIGATGAVVTAQANTVPGNTYNYRVSARNGAGSSGYVVATLALPMTAPAAPTGLATAVTGPNTVYVVWTDNASDESGYSLEVSSNAGALWGTVAEWNRSYLESVTTGGLVNYTATALPGSTDIYRVSAFKINNLGVKTYSPLLTGVAVPVAAPVAVAALTATADVTGTFVTLAWTDNTTNENSYYAEVSTDGGVTWAGLPQIIRAAADIAATGGAVSIVHSGTVPGLATTYTYRVSSFNGVGQSAYTTTSVLIP